MRDDIIRDSTLKDSSILIPEALKLYKALDIQTVSPITKVAIADFMMIVVGLSLPEATMLKKVMTWKLIGIFFGTLTLFFILSGWLFNWIL